MTLFSTRPLGAIDAGRRVLAFLLVAALLPGCMAAEPVRPGEPVALLIQGYNYTDDYIESFTVNGQGGGNVFESGPDSGGGGSVCCASYLPGTPLPIKLKVRWTSGYCLYTHTNKYGETYTRRRPRWSEQDVLVDRPPEGEARALEVHFFPDGHVEAAITEGHSPPRLKLARDADYNRPGAQRPRPPCSAEDLR